MVDATSTPSEPPSLSQCVSPADCIRLQGLWEEGKEDCDGAVNLDTPFLAPDVHDEIQNHEQSDSNSFWIYMDHICDLARADAKARSPEQYDKILNEYV